MTEKTVQSTKPTTQNANPPIGELETKHIAMELPTTVTINDESFTINHDSEIPLFNTYYHPENVVIEAPCKYCDEKLKFEYSGHVPTPVSAPCSHCGDEITIIKEGGRTHSTEALLSSIKEYHKKRKAYFEGQQNAPSNVSKFLLRAVGGAFMLLSVVFLIASLFSLALLGPPTFGANLGTAVYVSLSFCALLSLGGSVATPQIVSFILGWPYKLLNWELISDFLEGLHQDK